MLVDAAAESAARHDNFGQPTILDCVAPLLITSIGTFQPITQIHSDSLAFGRPRADAQP